MGWKRIGLMRRSAAGGEPRERVPFLSGSTVKKPVFKGIIQEMSQIPDGWGKGTPWV